jgi:hypothetical protein
VGEAHGRLKSKQLPIVVRLLSTALFSKVNPLAAILISTFAIESPIKKRTGSAETRGQIIGRILIDERPAIVDKKIRIGD